MVSKRNAILIGLGVCAIKIVIVLAIAAKFLHKNNQSRSTEPVLGNDGFCINRNTPINFQTDTRYDSNFWSRLNDHNEPLQFTYTDTKFEDINTKNGILEMVGSESAKHYKMSIYDEQFGLRNINFLSPSLHTINKKRFDLEVQMLFENEKTEQVSVNLLFDRQCGFVNKARNRMGFFQPMKRALKQDNIIYSAPAKPIQQFENPKIDLKKVVIDKPTAPKVRIGNGQPRKLDAEKISVDNYFAYMGSTALGPCSHPKEIPHIVVDTCYNDNLQFIFMPRNFAKMMQHLQESRAEIKDSPITTKIWSDLVDRAVIPMNGGLTAFHDNEKRFGDDRSFWRSISYPNNTKKLSALELQLSSYTKEWNVIRQLVDNKLYIKDQVPKYKQNDTVGLRDLLVKKWEFKRAQLSCILQKSECDKHNEERDLSMFQKGLENKLFDTFQAIDKNVDLVHWLIGWYENVALSLVDNNDLSVYTKNKKETVRLVKYNYGTKRYYYDADMATLDQKLMSKEKEKRTESRKKKFSSASWFILIPIVVFMCILCGFIFIDRRHIGPSPRNPEFTNQV